MTSSADRILTTHVGSLIRPPQFVEILKLKENGLPYDAAAYAAMLRQSVHEIVRQQAEIGIDIVSDGEFGKSNSWARYVLERLTGFEARDIGADIDISPPKDRRDFPEFYAEYDRANGMGGMVETMAVTRPIRYAGQDLVRQDIENLKNGLNDVSVAGGFLPVVAPASVVPERIDKFYADDEAYAFAVAEAMREEYRAIHDAGLILQIDDAYIPYNYERMVPPGTLTDYRRWATTCVEALNHALEGIPQDRVRYHICWGSWNGPHAFDVPMKDIVDLMLQVNVGAYQFEAANPRHEHEWVVWRSVKLPPGKVLIPGVISHATNIVEHPELVAQRIVRLAGIVGKENVMGGTDCGFAQSPFAQRVHPSIMWAKLRSLAEGAKIATRELWGQRSAA